MRLRKSRRGAVGFTILELATVIVVICILVVMFQPIVGEVQSRMQRVSCTANMRSLHVATNLYIQEHHSWPQITYHGATPQSIAQSWMAVTKPYGLQQINFICPTTQRLLLNPDLTDPNNARTDYIATPFDSNPQTPFKWPNQPWFIEAGNVHGNGNLIIFPDGHIDDLFSLRARLPSSSPSPTPH